MKNLNQLRFLLKHLVMVGSIAILAVHGNMASAQPTFSFADINAQRTVRPEYTSQNVQDNTYVIGGSVIGLTRGNTVGLINNGSDNLSVQQNGSFVFPTKVAEGAPYQVVITRQPPGQSCSVSKGSGTVSTNVLDIQVFCESR